MQRQLDGLRQESYAGSAARAGQPLRERAASWGGLHGDARAGSPLREQGLDDIDYMTGASSIVLSFALDSACLAAAAGAAIMVSNHGAPLLCGRSRCFELNVLFGLYDGTFEGNASAHDRGRRGR